jgi:hypothetical protein
MVGVSLGAFIYPKTLGIPGEAAQPIGNGSRRGRGLFWGPSIPGGRIFIGSKRPPPTARPTGQGGGLRPPPFPMGLAVGGDHLDVKNQRFPGQGYGVGGLFSDGSRSVFLAKCFFWWLGVPRPRNHICSRSEWFLGLATFGGKAKHPLVS